MPASAFFVEGVSITTGCQSLVLNCAVSLGLRQVGEFAEKYAAALDVLSAQAEDAEVVQPMMMRLSPQGQLTAGLV